jgi:hypothetical protein
MYPTRHDLPVQHRDKLEKLLNAHLADALDLEAARATSISTTSGFWRPI